MLIILTLFSVEMREVHEIRVGKNYKDFERWPEEAKRIENLRCFVVFYGSEFKLKSLSIAGNCSCTVLSIDNNFELLDRDGAIKWGDKDWALMGQGNGENCLI